MLRQEVVSERETRLVVSGPLYGEPASEFEKKIEALCDSAYALVTLDLSMAVGITSPTIGKLIATNKRLLAQNRRLRIKGCNEVLYQVFQKIKLDTLMEITR